jgi:hypothetical protein
MERGKEVAFIWRNYMQWKPTSCFKYLNVHSSPRGADSSLLKWGALRGGGNHRVGRQIPYVCSPPSSSHDRWAACGNGKQVKLLVQCLEFRIQGDSKVQVYLWEHRCISRGELRHTIRQKLVVSSSQGHKVTWHRSHGRHLGLSSPFLLSNTCYHKCTGTFESPCTYTVKFD